MKSMTAYRVVHKKHNNITFQFIFKSLNHRFISIDIKLPDNLSPMEDIIRKKIMSYIKRGSILFHINISYPNRNNTMIDVTRIKKVIEYLHKKGLNINSLSITDLIQFSHLSKQYSLQIDSRLKSFILQTVEDIIADVLKSKNKEGESMKKIISSLLSSIEKKLCEIEKILPEVQKKKETYFFNKLKEFDNKLKEAGIIQSVEIERITLAQLIQKTYLEEIKRLNIHIKHFKDLIKQDVGAKELDFLSQEMYREITTLLNKAEDAKISQLGVKIKKHIEDIREILNNIE